TIAVESAEDQQELLAQQRPVEHTLDLGGTEVRIDALCRHVHEIELGIQPMLDLARQAGAGLADAGLGLRAQAGTHLSDLQERQQAEGDEQQEGAGGTHLVGYSHDVSSLPETGPAGANARYCTQRAAL